MNGDPGTHPDAGGTQRLDKWLWFARVVKTRTLAASLVLDGKVRVNRLRIHKPSQTVRPGDVITVTAHSRVRVLMVLSTGERRGPAVVAQTLYEDLTPQPADGKSESETAVPQREPGSGRPTKRDRRAIQQFTKRER